MKSPAVFLTWCVLACLSLAALAADVPEMSAPIQLQRDDREGQLRILIDGQEAIVYRYGDDVDLPHYCPVRSPSGRPMTVQLTESHPYHHPHHRSVWFADIVQVDGGRKVSFFTALYSRVDPKDPKSPFRDRVRHVKFLGEEVTPKQAVVKTQLLWEADLGKMPMLDEYRTMRVARLGDGEYLIDLTFELKAAYGEAAFLSDQVHYAWPYVRMNPRFSGERGGTLTNSEGGVHQKGTDGKYARWVDYSNTIDGVAEGLAIFSAPENDHPHRWLTREYGAFGPRRAEARNGKPFTLKQGDSLKQRVGILIHDGDVNTGRVKKRYQQYTEGKL